MREQRHVCLSAETIKESPCTSSSSLDPHRERRLHEAAVFLQDGSTPALRSIYEEEKNSLNKRRRRRRDVVREDEDTDRRMHKLEMKKKEAKEREMKRRDDSM